MDKLNSSPFLPRHHRVWWRQIKLRWPLLVWLSAAAGAFWLYRQGGGGAALQGVVETVYEVAAPLETARLNSYCVEVGQRVNAGDILACFDTALIDAEITIKRLEVDQQFRSIIARTTSELYDAIRRHSHEAAEMHALGEELERMEDMVQRRLLDAQDVLPFRMRYQVLSETATNHKTEMTRLEEELAALRMRQEKMTIGWTGVAPNDDKNIKGGKNNQEADKNATQGWLALRRDQYTLKAQHAGIVTRLHVQPGTVVQAGSPVVTLVVDQPPRVIGFLTQWFPQCIEPGRTLYVGRVGGGPIIRGRVQTMNPEILRVPTTARLGVGAGQVIEGRQIIVELMEKTDFLPGESVNLYTRRPWWRILRFRQNTRK